MILTNKHGLTKRRAEELHEWADKLEAAADQGGGLDDPRYLLRWAEKMRRLAVQKEKAKEHKERSVPSPSVLAP